MHSLSNTSRPSLRRTAFWAMLFASGVALAGCSTSVGPLTSSSPNVFYANLGPTDLTGEYNPAGFSSADVQAGLAQICGNRKITNYSEQPAGGMVAFSGHCYGGTTVRMGTITFTRDGNRLRIVVPGYVERDRMRESRTWSILL